MAESANVVNLFYKDFFLVFILKRRSEVVEPDKVIKAYKAYNIKF